jgi:hypothetical protein
MEGCILTFRLNCPTPKPSPKQGREKEEMGSFVAFFGATKLPKPLVFYLLTVREGDWGIDVRKIEPHSIGVHL